MIWTNTRACHCLFAKFDFPDPAKVKMSVGENCQLVTP